MQLLTLTRQIKYHGNKRKMQRRFYVEPGNRASSKSLNLILLVLLFAYELHSVLFVFEGGKSRIPIKT